MPLSHVRLLGRFVGNYLIDVGMLASWASIHCRILIRLAMARHHFQGHLG